MRIKFYLLVMTLTALFCKEGLAQNKITVTGIVRDKNANAVMGGVTISAGNPPKTLGTTDDKGAFTVTVDAGSVLQFTFSGFEPVSRTVITGGTPIEIILSPRQNSMTEVIVQGFKTKTRETSTGSSTIISGKALQDVPVSNVMELLQGKVAGLNIQNNNGSPGGMGTIQMRGLSSINISGDGFLTPTSPLFVIDGVPVDVNSNYEYGFQGGGPGISPLALIPPEDIEQMDFLKDAAATSQYGSRGAYGVIIVTTKRGSSKVPIIQYSSNFFVKSPPKLRNVIGGREERLSRIRAIMAYDTSYAAAQALVNETSFLSDSLNPYYNNATNWQDYFFRSTYNQQHNLSISGGDVKFNYKTNLNYYQENGIIENTGFRRYSLSMNAAYQPTETFRAMINLSTSLGQKQNGSGVGLVQTGVASGASTSSLLPPPSLFSENNSVLAASTVKNNNKTSNIASSFDISYEPVKGIRFGNLLSYNFNSGTTDRFTASTLNAGSSEAYSYNDRTYTLYNRSMINFVKAVNTVHNFSGYLFNEINSYGFKANAIQLTQTAHDQIEGPIGYNPNITGGGSLNNIRDTRQHGYGGSFSYNFDRKYIIDFSYRFDGLSTNGPSQGYSQNPAVSARWNFGREKFFDKAYWLNYGSLRASWGRNIKPTGNIFDVYGKYIAGSQYNNDPTVTIDFGTAPNVNFLPETQTQTNLALEFGLWDNTVSAILETYYRSIDNQVIGVTLADINGFTRVQTNAVSLVNYGFDWSTTFRLFKKKKVNWDLSINGALNRDVLTALPNNLRQMEIPINDAGASVPIIYRIGRNSLSNLLYHTQGVYGSTGDVPVNLATGRRQQLGAGSGFYFQGGDPRWTDVNGDYVIDANDLLPIGNPVPKVTGGVNSRTTYKGFTLNVNVTYTLFRDLLNSAMADMFRNYSQPTAINALLPIEAFTYWRPTDLGKGTGSVNAGFPNPFDFRRAGILQPFRTNQTLFLEDGSYWKINNLVLAYNVDRNLLNRYGMTSLRLSLSANNVYTFSNYSGPDPELVTALGRDVSGGFPNARSYAIGVNIQF